jgi:hypothetical protein
MREQDWQDAGRRWQGRSCTSSRQRRVVILRRSLGRSVALAQRDDVGQLPPSFAEFDDGGEIWEYAVLVTSLDNEILSMGQLYRDRADRQNVFDELKNR